jgi:tetratricopeptide (TPR) repeat protein
LNKFDEAIADFTRAIVINPDNANVYRERARAYLARANNTNKPKDRNLDLEKSQLDSKFADAVEKQNPQL